MAQEKEPIVKAPSGRVRRIPLSGRNVLTVQGKDPNYAYRIVNDEEDRIARFQDAGYELVADEDDGVALVPELAQFGEEFFGFLGREDGGGFVEDEDFGTPVEGLEDLDLLAHGHRHVGHPGPGRHPQVVPGRQGLALGDGGFEVEEPGPGPPGFVAQDEVLGQGEAVHQHEVLVNHSDTGRHCVAGSGELLDNFVQKDLALVCLIQTE